LEKERNQIEREGFPLRSPEKESRVGGRDMELLDTASYSSTKKKVFALSV